MRLSVHALLTALLLAGLTPGPGSAQVGPARVEIYLAPKVPSQVPVKGAIVLQPAEGSGEPVRLTVGSAADHVVATLPAGSSWEAAGEFPGFWVPRKSLKVGAATQPVRLALDLWPLGTISGVVKMREKGAPLPKQVLVKTLAAPSFLKRPAVPPGAIDCPVDPKGAWSCRLPATTFDLVISTAGSIPHYRWAVKVPAAGTLSLGTFELRRGSSVAGWVAVDDGGIEPHQCLVRLAVLTAGGADLRSIAEIGRTALQQEVSPDGFFQFTGLAPGSYALEVRQPGYPAVRSAPIRVDAGAETFLPEPVVLRHALDLSFEIHPPLDWLGRPWHAQVFKLGGRPPIPVVFDGPADKEGRLNVPGQSEGRYRVSLKDSLGNSLYSGEHTVDAPAPAPQSIEVRFVTVEGKVRLGGEPLPAVLWFGGRSGAIASKMESDTNGRFQGVLPREGLWRIEIEASKPAFSTWARAEVEASRSGKARLDIDLPDTRVFGRVVDEQGKPVPGASVAVRGEALDLFQTTDSAGAFEARGLSAGPVWLGAEAASKISERTLATLVEGSAVGPIELRLRPTRRLTGTVVSSQGPVAGARVTLLARSPSGGAAAALTDARGDFAADLPQSVSRVVAIASAPGFALRAFDLEAGDKPLLLQVTEEDGALQVSLPLNREELQRENLFLATFQNGLPIPAAVLTQWASDGGAARSSSGSTLAIPHLAPGTYQVCLLLRGLEILLPWSSPPSGPGCDSGTLAPGGTLALKPPAPG